MSEDEIRDAEVKAWARCDWTGGNEGLPEMILIGGTVEPIRRVHMAGFRAGWDAARTPGPATADLRDAAEALMLTIDLWTGVPISVHAMNERLRKALLAEHGAARPEKAVEP